MRITLAVALVAISGSTALAQESSQIGSVTDLSAPEISTTSVIDSETISEVVPVVYQSGTVGDRAAGVVDAVSNVGTVEGTIEGAIVTEPTSVVSGEVMQEAPDYSQMAPVDGGAVVTEGVPMATTSSCGCGGGSAAPMTYSAAPVETAAAPVVTYSSAPVQYSAPASNPCCNQPRRGFFRALFGN